jgi:hypothetical protein
MIVFWVVAPCSLVDVYRCFTGACFLLPPSFDELQYVCVTIGHTGCRNLYYLVVEIVRRSGCRFV